MEKSVNVKLALVDEVKKLNKIATSSEADVRVHSNSYVVDAKSLLGIFSLDLSKPVEIKVKHDDTDVVNRFLYEVRQTVTALS